MASVTDGTDTGPGATAEPGSDLLITEDGDQQPALSFVLPTLNEEAGIEHCIRRIYRAVEELGLSAEIVVSDSSTDRTPAIARRMGARVVTPDEPGYGYAYRYGFARARGEYVVMGDADTTYDFAELPRLLEPVRSGRADICMGDRLGGTIEDGAMPPLHEHVGNPLLTRFLNAFYDAGVSDAHSGFRVFRREILADLELSSTGMEFASEMIMAAGEADLTIEEVPITYHEREGEATLDSFQDGWRHVRFMLVHAPDYLFSLPGLVLGALGVALLGLSVAGVPVAGLRFGTNSAIAGSLLTLTGFQVGSFAVLGSIAADPIRTPDGSVTGWLLESFRLEHGATAGLVLLGAGAGFTANALLSWLAGGAATLPVVPVNMAAFTAIVLGVQVVFTSFFFSLLAGE